MNARILEHDYSKHYSSLMAMAYKTLRNIHDAEEAVAHAYARATERINSYDPSKGTVFRWLRAITLHSISDIAERKTVRASDGKGIDLAQIASREQVPLEHVVREEERGEAARHILSDPLLIQHYYQGLTYEQIGRIAGIGLGTVRSRFHRAYMRARKALAHLGP